MSIVHVIPQNDLRDHTDARTGCWCEPSVADLGLDEHGEPARVFTHHAADGREHREADHDRARCARCREAGMSP